MSELLVESIVGLDECPHCHDTSVKAIAPELSETRRQESTRYKCRSCSSTWRVVYRFVSIEDVQVPDQINKG